jgi:hypothetical protein
MGAAEGRALKCGVQGNDVGGKAEGRLKRTKRRGNQVMEFQSLLVVHRGRL